MGLTEKFLSLIGITTNKEEKSIKMQVVNPIPVNNDVQPSAAIPLAEQARILAEQAKQQIINNWVAKALQEVEKQSKNFRFDAAIFVEPETVKEGVIQKLQAQGFNVKAQGLTVYINWAEQKKAQ